MEECNRFDLTILYVEDDGITRLEIEQALRRRAKRVLVAEDGRVGLELFREHQPELVVTDIRMPVMDGLQMANAIHQLSSEVRIIATTAYSEASYIIEAIEVGIDHYVLKPIDMVRFVAAIEKCSLDILAQKALKRHHEEREKLIAELQAALEEIKALQGIVPICSYCKSIRNDEGYWEQVEAYIAHFSKAEFSHSICPSCMKRHHPEEYETIMARRKAKELSQGA